MPSRHIPIAIAYDFDGTLAPGNMQEFDFVPRIGMTTKEFWLEVANFQKTHEADNILVYMWLMLEKAHGARIPVRKNDIEQYGVTIGLFDGVSEWFRRINKFGRENGTKIEHFIISSGLREMIGGTSIANNFKAIYASSFIYDENGVARWPALALNYTTKTQYLFRINKGSLHVYDHSRINEFVPLEDRPIPFENMIFIGDGDTDIPCFRLVKDQGGHSIAVYQQRKRGAKRKAEKLIGQGRVNFTAPANYREGSDLDQIVKSTIKKIAADGALRRLGKKA